MLHPCFNVGYNAGVTPTQTYLRHVAMRVRLDLTMASSTQFSLFTAFILVTGCGVILSIFASSGFVAGLPVAFVFLMVACLRQITSRQVGTPCLVTSTQANNGLRDIECVIAAADIAIVDESNCCIEFLKPPVGDDDVASLAELPELKWLVLDNTNVSDAGLVFFYGLTKLRRLYIRGSQVTAEGVQRLQLALPKLEVLH